ncbi:probable rhamnogalacturonate lyase B [Malania oleifera]|uniref:probable rhamnogalacturonate lyase B n=1 Tax=Malania oleifera TaxID=397392 RepID=UPI0025ADB25E|nr:probable rhamnogalacturonate lyase B [Malania oleifera]
MEQRPPSVYKHQKKKKKKATHTLKLCLQLGNHPSIHSPSSIEGIEGMGRGRMNWVLQLWWMGKVVAHQLLLGLVPAWSLQESTPAASCRRVQENSNGRLPNGVQLLLQHQKVVMDNGLVRVSLSVPDGFVTSLQYKGSDNLLEPGNDEDDRGYWDIVGYNPESESKSDKIKGTSFQVIKNDTNQIELSFLRTWNASAGGSGIPLNIDKRFIMLAGQTGFYSYGIYERLQGWPDLDIDQTRIVFKLRQSKFRYMALSDERQRIMPQAQDREAGKPLAYPEAVLLSNSTNAVYRGEVDDKYMYSCPNKDNRVHGWISYNPNIGFWIITPSNEFRTAGPVKQDLTSHVGPTALSMFVSVHYAGKSTALQFRNGEPWKKVFGPVFMHLNSAPSDQTPSLLWNDAKAQMQKETESWPYDFPLSKDFPYAAERGNVTGQLLVCDRYINEECMPGGNAQVGLALPGDIRSWQTESKLCCLHSSLILSTNVRGTNNSRLSLEIMYLCLCVCPQGYQFWTQTDKDGNFLIKGVRSGNYSLYAWVPGIVGDYKHTTSIIITPGSAINLSVLKYYPPRHGPTFWEIGIPDRTAAEFFIPDPVPWLINHLYIKQDKFRQYGLWQQYTTLYPKKDLVYTVGVSVYRKDWFYAHVTRSLGNDEYRATTWQILFDLQNVSSSETYMLQLALASTNGARLEVRFNNQTAQHPHFSTGLIGRDNAIARHGIYGLYTLHNVSISGSQLNSGRNTIFLTQSNGVGPFQGLMYDYLRFEGPPNSN